ncbi:heterokaryon incompatibility protein-domain-containing protein [Immersiella caudata]|uniref:Heterokaryon incompatibility protein-domain-containing protein n=1 Tax=Immersiella caudata TaxID=314043 RepID=A0AA39WP04_9PEZI|nr:heterokaryon incompatibility protein-domain-containing protein [Immersiella caudata]
MAAPNDLNGCPTGGVENGDRKDDSMDEVYNYEPLPTSTSIRLLKLLSKTESGLLHISLKTVDLRNDPAYRALSYSWGNPHANGVDFTVYYNSVADEYSASHRIPIACGGKRLHIQQNLFDALCQLSTSGDSDEDDADGYLWVDALCINQQDYAERAAQVKIMDQVYSKAAHTVIWLGRVDAEIISTSDAFRVITQVASYPLDTFAQSNIVPFRRQAPSVYTECDLAPISWMEWCAFAALLKRQWFSRLWIVQETILSPRLLVFCGPHRIPWNTLVTAAQNIDARCTVLGARPSTLFIQHDQPAVPLENNVLQLARWREYWHSPNPRDLQGRPFTLETLIQDTWTFQATDPRDKIYGLFGLMDAATRNTWVVDYNTPVEEAYAFATMRVMHHSRTLSIISCIQDASVRKVAPRPSWVPDFGLPYVNMLCNSHFSAAGTGAGSDPPTLPSPCWDRLRLHGMAVDEIIEVANDRNNYPNSMMLLESSWFEMAMLLPHPYHKTGHDPAEVLWRTLCADQDAVGNSPAPETFGPLFHELLCAMVVVRAELEAENAQKTNPPVHCAPSFAEAMRRARKMWDDLGLADLGLEQLREKMSAPPRFLSRPELGWLAFTLLKMYILAKMQSGAAIPDLDALEEFEKNPTYVMRVIEGEERSLVYPKDAAFMKSYQLRYGMRKLFFTKGGYLGLGPASARVGDMILVFRGAAGPFVCRVAEADEPQDGVERFEIVGESYVHGLMHGEATRMGGFALKEVEIL